MLARIVEHPAAARLARLAAVALPVIFAARPLGDDRHALAGRSVPEPHGRSTCGGRTGRHRLRRGGHAGRQPARSSADGPLRAESAHPGRRSTAGSSPWEALRCWRATKPRSPAWAPASASPAGNLPNITTRFIQAFGDDYDQIAVFLSFNDRASLTALAYQHAGEERHPRPGHPGRTTTPRCSGRAARCRRS